MANPIFSFVCLVALAVALRAVHRYGARPLWILGTGLTLAGSLLPTEDPNPFYLLVWMPFVIAVGAFTVYAYSQKDPHRRVDCVFQFVLSSDDEEKR